MLTHSYFKSALMKSEVGILALAAASIEKNVWEVRYRTVERTAAFEIVEKAMHCGAF